MTTKTTRQNGALSSRGMMPPSWRKRETNVSSRPAESYQDQATGMVVSMFRNIPAPPENQQGHVDLGNPPILRNTEASASAETSSKRARDTQEQW